MRFAIDADPRFGAFTLRTDCPRCGAHLPANGPVAEVDCADCGARVKVPAGLLRNLGDQLEERWPEVDASDTVTLGDLTWRWTSAAVAGPTCAGCAAPLHDDESDFALACTACGASTPCFAAPETLRHAVPAARRVYGADAEGTRPTIALVPVAMACPQCGAGLAITAAWQRLSPCSFCGMTVHLPDAVWRQLHPPRTVRPWTVRFDGESRAAMRGRLGREKAEAERARIEAERRGRQQEKARQQQAAVAARELHEKRAREKAEAERRWRLRTLPLVVVAWFCTPVAMVGLLAATAWYVLGTPTLLLGRVSPAILAGAPRVVVIAALFAAVVGWALAFAAVAVRTRQRVKALLPLSLMQLGVSSLPMVGWVFGIFFAVQHLRGFEPFWDRGTRIVPWPVRIPLATYFVAFGAYGHVVAAAVVDISMATMWQRFLEAG